MLVQDIGCLKHISSEHKPLHSDTWYLMEVNTASVYAIKSEGLKFNTRDSITIEFN
jgi:hypothetical protein